MFKYIQNFLLIVFLISLVSCSGKDLIEDGMNYNENASGYLHVSAIQHVKDNTKVKINPDQPKVIYTNKGYSIILDKALIRFASLTLKSKGDLPECMGDKEIILPIGKTKNLLSEDGVPLLLSDEQIPKINYCRFNLVLGPAEKNDAKFHGGGGDGVFTDGEEISTTFEFAGTWGKENVGAGPFTFSGELPIELGEAFLALESGQILPHALHFHSDAEETSLVIGINYENIFDDMIFDKFSDEIHQQNVDQLYKNIQLSLHQHLTESVH